MSTQVNILVYEDDEACGFAFASILRHAGYRVTVASNFEAALNFLDSEPPIDLLLTDIVMPEGGVHGAALGRMARLRNSAIRIVYVSGYDVPVHLAGLDGPLLRKPVSEEQLLTAVAAALGRDD